jgi:hypothetical protein
LREILLCLYVIDFKLWSFGFLYLLLWNSMFFSLLYMKFRM